MAKKLDAIEAGRRTGADPFADRARIEKLADPVMAEYGRKSAPTRSTPRSTRCDSGQHGRRKLPSCAGIFLSHHRSITTGITHAQVYRRLLPAATCCSASAWRC